MALRKLQLYFLLNRNCHVFSQSKRAVSFKLYTDQKTSVIGQPSLFPFIRTGNLKFYTQNTIKNEKSGLDFIKKLELLKQDGTNQQRVQSNQFKDIIKNIKGRDISHEDGIFLLQCCGDYLPDFSMKDKPDLLNKVWNEIVTNNVTIDHYLSLLRMKRKTRSPITDFRKFLSEVKIEANIQIYEELLYLASEMGQIDQMQQILAEMKEKNYPATEKVFNALILGHSRNKDMSNVELVLDTMSAANLEPSSETITELIKAYVENGVMEKANSTLGKNGFLLNVNQLIDIMRSAIYNPEKQGDSNFVANVVKYLPEDILYANKVAPHIKTFCTELVYNWKPLEAMSIINALPKPVFQSFDDLDGYASFFINEILITNQYVEDIKRVCRDLIKSERNPRAFHVATEIALKNNSVHSLELLKALSEIEPLKPHYFWPLLLNQYRTKGEQGIIDVVKEMVNLNVDLDFDTIQYYILPKLSITLRDARKAVKLLEDKGIKMSQLITPLSSYLLYQYRFSEIIDLIKTYQSKLDCESLVTPLVAICSNNRSVKTFHNIANLVKLFTEKSTTIYDLGGKLLMELVAQKNGKIDYNGIAKLIQEFTLAGVKISNISSEIVLQVFDRAMKSDLLVNIQTNLKDLVDKKLSSSSVEILGSHITHPRDMTLEELECHLVELEAKRLNVRGVLRRLLQLCVREGKLERALQVKKLCDEQKVELSPGMLASILDLNIKTKNLKDAEWTWLELKKSYPGFLIDEHKKVDFAALLVENGFVTEAKKMLSNRSASKMSTDSKYIYKNLWNLLNNMAIYVSKSDKEFPENQTKLLFEFLLAHNYCTHHNTLLGPIIREYLVQHKIKEAVKEFCDIVEKYRKTPLQLELMTLLVKISNEKPQSDLYKITAEEAKELLTNINNASSKVHGMANSQLTLIFALAEAGTENQLRKLLIDPNIRINSDLFQRQCEFLSNSGKIEPIVKLAKCSRGLGHAIKEQDMYTLLLQSFIRDNNYSSALELFEQIVSDDEFKVSSEFKKSLIELLQRNNLEIPTTLALHAKIGQ